MIPEDNKESVISAEFQIKPSENGFAHAVDGDDDGETGFARDHPSEDDEDEDDSTAPGQKLQAKWDQMYDRLLVFKRRHGHCLVPNRYSDDPQLGSWVSTQRRHYKILTSGNGESTPMTPARAQKLVEIGFKWSTKDPRHVPWEHRYSELSKFSEKYGHSQVPIGWEENVQLSNWVSTQRQEYKLIQRGRQSRLTDDRIKLLNKLDFVWEAQRGGPRRKRKATVAVPPKANPVDAAKLRAKAVSRGAAKAASGVASTAHLQASAAQQQAQQLQDSATMDQALAAFNAFGGAANMFPAGSVAIPAQQWQLLTNGAFQKSMPQIIALVPGNSIFPLATQMPFATAGFQFGANPFLAQNQLAALQQQQQQAAFFMLQQQQAAAAGAAGQQEVKEPKKKKAKKKKKQPEPIDDGDEEEDMEDEGIAEDFVPAGDGDDEKGAEIFYNAGA